MIVGVRDKNIADRALWSTGFAKPEIQVQWETLPLKPNLEVSWGRHLTSFCTLHAHVHIHFPKHVCVHIAFPAHIHSSSKYKRTHGWCCQSSAFSHHIITNIVPTTLCIPCSAKQSVLINLELLVSVLQLYKHVRKHFVVAWLFVLRMAELKEEEWILLGHITVVRQSCLSE